MGRIHLGRVIIRVSPFLGWIGSGSVFSFGSGLFRLFHRLRVGSLHAGAVSNDISILLSVGIFGYKIELDPKIQILVF